MNNTGSNQTAQTVANALSGEKAFETVQFAITGDPIADAISGIMAVLKKINLASYAVPHARHAALLLEYLAKGFDCEACEKEKESDTLRRMAAPFPPSMPDPLYPPQYTTASGTVPYPDKDEYIRNTLKSQMMRDMVLNKPVK